MICPFCHQTMIDCNDAIHKYHYVCPTTTEIVQLNGTNLIHTHLYVDEFVMVYYIGTFCVHNYKDAGTMSPGDEEILEFEYSRIHHYTNSRGWQIVMDVPFIHLDEPGKLLQRLQLLTTFS